MTLWYNIVSLKLILRNFAQFITSLISYFMLIVPGLIKLLLIISKLIIEALGFPLALYNILNFSYVLAVFWQINTIQSLGVNDTLKRAEKGECGIGYIEQQGANILQDLKILKICEKF